VSVTSSQGKSVVCRAIVNKILEDGDILKIIFLFVKTGRVDFVKDRK
jgi:predicted Holliday junction resolvase-like endonuclease